MGANVSSAAIGIRGAPSRLMLVALLCSGLSVVVALRFADHGWKEAALLVAVSVGAVVLTALALRRFEYFVLVLLALRPAVDWFHVESASGSSLVASAMSGIFLLAAVVWLTARLTVQERRPAPPIAWALGALLVACVASVTRSVDPAVTLAEGGRFLSAAAMYVVLERLIVSAGGMRRVLTACYVSALVPLAVGVVHVATGAMRTGAEQIPRLQATFAHPNAFGYYLALLSVMAVALLPHTRGRARAGLGAVLVLCLSELVLTYSRGSWLALIIGLVVVGVLQSRRLLALVVAGLVILPLAVPSVGARVTDLGNERTLRGTGGNSLVWRLDHWRETLTLADDQPMTGIGLKMTTRLVDGGNIPHNDYVRTFVELGLLGLTAYVLLLLALVTAAWSAVRRAPPGLARGVAVGFAACVASFCIVSVGTNRITSVVELWYFFAFAAAGAAVSRWGRPGTAT